MFTVKQTGLPTSYIYRESYLLCKAHMRMLPEMTQSRSRAHKEAEGSGAFPEFSLW